MINLRHNLILWTNQEKISVLAFGKNADSFSFTFGWSKVVSQQSESCVFRAWSSGCALFVCAAKI